MSDAVTPTLSQVAAGITDGQAAPATSKPADGKQPADAGKAMRLHLAKRQEERKDEPEPEAGAPDEAPEAEVKADEPEAEPADDAKPHWAKKLKGDLEAAQRKVGEHSAQMQRVAEGARLARDRISDLTVQAEHHKAYAEWLEKQIDLAGYEVPQVQRDLFAQKLELATLKASAQRGQAQTNDAAVSDLKGKLVARANALIGKFPELDPKVNPDARAFWQAALAVSPDPKVPAPKLDDLEAQAEAWAAIRRGRKLLDAEATRKKAAPPPPAQKPTPTVAGQRGAGGKPTPQKQAPISAKTMHDYIAKKRAARGA